MDEKEVDTSGERGGCQDQTIGRSRQCESICITQHKFCSLAVIGLSLKEGIAELDLKDHVRFSEMPF